MQKLLKPNPILGLVILVFSLGIFSSISRAQEWTRFRGPNGQGVSDCKSIPASWSEDGYLWRAEIPGVGHSCPVFWGEKLFVMSADPDSAKQYVICMNAINGKKIWQKEFEIASYHIHIRNSFASVTPTVDATQVYVAWSTPDQTTFSAFTHDGELVWQRKLGAFDSSHGFGSSPILYEDLAILTHQQKKPDRNGPVVETSSVVAVERASGKTRWRTKLMSDKASYSVPCILKRDGQPDELLCCNTHDGIFSLNPKTGEKNWSNSVFSMRTVSSPVVSSGLVFGSTGSGGGGNYVVALQPGKNSKVAYEVKRQAPYVPTPVAKGDLMILWYDKGIVTCVDPKNGNRHWQERIGGNYSASPIIVDDKVYCVSDDGEVVVLAVSQKFKLLGRSNLGEDSRSTPAVANDRMYLRTYSHIVCVGNVRST